MFARVLAIVGSARVLAAARRRRKHGRVK